MRDPCAAAAGARAPWRSVLRRHLAWLLLLKFAALAALWALSFSPVHRTTVDAAAAQRQLAVLPRDARRPGESR
jgi:hypothetical protein